MDPLSESFGRLTTTAREWKPQQEQKQKQQPQVERAESSDWGQVESELNAASVKEFVPGKGWITQNTPTATATDTATQQGEIIISSVMRVFAPLECFLVWID
jgi:hypothetical protein